MKKNVLAGLALIGIVAVILVFSSGVLQIQGSRQYVANIPLRVPSINMAVIISSLDENTTRVYEFQPYSLVVSAPKDDWESQVEFDVVRVDENTFRLTNIRMNDDFKRNITKCDSDSQKNKCLDDVADTFRIKNIKLKDEIDRKNAYPVTAGSGVTASKSSIDLDTNSDVEIKFRNDGSGSVKLGFNSIDLSTVVSGNLVNKLFAFYADGTGPSKLRSYNPSVQLWGTENTTEDSINSNKEFNKICSAPNRNESILISETQGGNLNVQIFNGTNQTQNVTVASGIANAVYRYIDCAYDNESYGYVVWHNTTTQLHFFKYDYPNNGYVNLSAPLSCGSGEANLRLTSSLNEKRFVLQCKTGSDGNLSFQIFNGTGWQSQIFPSNLTDASRKRSSDCIWEPDNGNFYCFYGNSTPGNFTVIRANSANSWATLQTFGISNRSNSTVTFVRAEVAPRGRYAVIGLALNDSTATNGTVVGYLYDAKNESVMTGPNTEFLNVQSNSPSYPIVKVMIGNTTTSSQEPIDISWKYMASNNSNGTGCSNSVDARCYEQAFFSWSNGSAYVLTESLAVNRNITDAQERSTFGWTGVGPGLLPYIVISSLNSIVASEFVLGVNHDTYINEEDNTNGRKIGMMCVQDRVQDFTCWTFNESLTQGANELENSLPNANRPSGYISFMRLDNMTPVWHRVFDNSSFIPGDAGQGGTYTLPVIKLGGRINLGAILIDNYRLDKCWLETNETGQWENKTGMTTRLNRTATFQNCTFSWRNESMNIVGASVNISWRINFNDTQSCFGNNNPACGLNSTPVMTFQMNASTLTLSTTSPIEIEYPNSTISVDYTKTPADLIDTCRVRIDSSYNMTFKYCQNYTLTYTTFGNDTNVSIALDFSEGRGTTAYDKSVFGLNASLNNGVMWNGTVNRVRGTYGNYTSFDGTDDFINATRNASLGNLFQNEGGTLCTWVYPTSFGASNFMIVANKDTGIAGSGGWDFAIDNAVSGTLQFIQGFTTPGVWRSPASTVVLNTWQFVCVAYKAGVNNDPAFYLNGVQVATTETTPPAGSVVDDAGEELLIGNSQDANRGLDGSLDEFIIYHRNLTSQDILKLYQEENFNGSHYIEININNTANNKLNASTPFYITLAPVTANLSCEPASPTWRINLSDRCKINGVTYVTDNIEIFNTGTSPFNIVECSHSNISYYNLSWEGGPGRGTFNINTGCNMNRR